MFDTRLRPIIDPILERVARLLSRTGLPANALTLTGFAFGLCAGAAILLGYNTIACICVALNRLADGLDGPLARINGPTPLGAYYDIVLDFLFYGSLPLAFAIVDPVHNALPAAILLASFYANGATFLGFAALAAQQGLSTEAQGRKAIYYFAGIAEGAETIVVLLLMCLFPSAFAALALGFAVLCFVSAAARIIMVRAMLLDGG